MATYSHVLRQLAREHGGETRRRHAPVPATVQLPSSTTSWPGSRLRHTARAIWPCQPTLTHPGYTVGSHVAAANVTRRRQPHRAHCGATRPAAPAAHASAPGTMHIVVSCTHPHIRTPASVSASRPAEPGAISCTAPTCAQPARPRHINLPPPQICIYNSKQINISLQTDRQPRRSSQCRAGPHQLRHDHRRTPCPPAPNPRSITSSMHQQIKSNIYLVY